MNTFLAQARECLATESINHKLSAGLDISTPWASFNSQKGTKGEKLFAGVFAVLPGFVKADVKMQLPDHSKKYQIDVELQDCFIELNVGSTYDTTKSLGVATRDAKIEHATGKPIVRVSYLEEHAPWTFILDLSCWAEDDVECLELIIAEYKNTVKTVYCALIAQQQEACS